MYCGKIKTMTSMGQWWILHRERFLDTVGGHLVFLAFWRQVNNFSLILLYLWTTEHIPRSMFSVSVIIIIWDTEIPIFAIFVAVILKMFQRRECFPKFPVDIADSQSKSSRLSEKYRFIVFVGESGDAGGLTQPTDYASIAYFFRILHGVTFTHKFDYIPF